MRCFIVGSGASERVRDATAAAGALGCPVTLGPSVGDVAGDPAFADERRPLVIVTEDRDLPAAIRLARQEAGRAFVLHVADGIAPDLYKELVRTRAGEWSRPADLRAELPDVVASHAGDALRGRGAKIVSFAASKGGVGTTTLAIETAIHLATRRRGATRVALLDLNLEGGTLADALDVEPRFDLAEIVDRPERLDEQLVDVFTSRHASGIHVFAGPARPALPDGLLPQTVFDFIDAISVRYDRVLLDLPVRRDPWTDGLLRGSDAVVVPGGGEIPALRRLATRLAALRELGAGDERVAAIVNAADVDLLGRVRHKAEVERALSGCRVFFVRRDRDGVAGAANTGSTLAEVAPNSRALRDIRAVADWIEQTLGAGPAAPGAKP